MYINVGAEARTLTGIMYVAGKPRAQDSTASSQRPLQKPKKKVETVAAKPNSKSPLEKLTRAEIFIRRHDLSHANTVRPIRGRKGLYKSIN